VKAMQVTGLAAGREYLRFFLIRWELFAGFISDMVRSRRLDSSNNRAMFCSLPSARNSTCCSIPSAKYADKSGKWLIFPQTEQVN